MATVPKTPIQTIVFFDLEATSLTRPRITELCLLSVQREEFLTRNGSPRVVNKLTLCVDPQKAISPIANNMTGLYNDSLESQTPFDNKVVDIMAHFLSRLPQPVCLVAHYGHGFDYPLLNAELKRAKCELPLDVVCVDSLEAIRAIDMQTLYEQEQQRIDMQNQNNSTPTHRGIQSGQGVQPNNSTTPELQTQPTHTATVKQDTMLAKRKADAGSIEHVRKRLFTDSDKVAKEVENSEDKTKVEMACCKEKQTVEATRQLVQNLHEINPETAVVPTPSRDTPEQPKAQEEQNVGLQSIAASSVLDSQQSVTDDMLMEAVESVEADENFEKAGTSMTKCPPSVSNVTLKPSTQRTSPPQAHVMCSNNDSNSGTGNDKAGLPGTSVSVPGNSGVCFTGNVNAQLPETSGVHDVKSIDRVPNNGFQSAQPSAGDTVRCKTSIDQLHTPVKSSNNNVTPVTTGVNNNNNSVTNQDHVTPMVLPKLSYKLEEIYYRTFGQKPPLSHNAEDDCITLMKVCKKRCPQFLEWVNKHQVLLSTLPPMY
ncbi:uncharacterized protein LOC110449460 isoform X2 [Mizuhopecten yessoensis]|uniref:uncharacterized protein LOC110449460 isoform X2 n=1 Tax=Mizuhopecten yessoensis TaxID=6573 RepID=UPI000B45E57C|nr:uncharacterized protein LOC110449460 isoform X2 [Mizuhopecten yessoensis]